MSAGVVVGRRGQDATAAVCDTAVPIGAIAPAIPEWCKVPLATGATTFTQSGNSWLDDWNHNLTHADIGAGYRTFNVGATDSLFWRHNNHWMVDVQPGGAHSGGGLLRPDRSFAGASGKLVIEADVAAGIEAYNAGAWPELIVTTAPQPTGMRLDALYGYDMFDGHWTFGCRLNADRNTACSLLKDTQVGGETRSGRLWEINWWTCRGTVCRANTSPMRTCAGTDPDINCRDRFRLELTPDSVAVYINGQEALYQSGLPAGLSNLVGGQPIYAYFGSNFDYPIASGLSAAGTQVVRFHWDHLAVNPAGGPSAPPPPPPPTATPTNTPVPAVVNPTNTPAPTNTPVPSIGGSCRIQVRQANGTWKTVATGTYVNGICTP
jgi:hypothetical protein